MKIWCGSYFSSLANYENPPVKEHNVTLKYNSVCKYKIHHLLKMIDSPNETLTKYSS